MIRIAPSLLSANFANLEDEVKGITQAGADLVHLDVMDGHFVPNLTFGVPIIGALRGCTHLAFDVHLMVENPGQYLEPLAKVGADMVTVHVEATLHLHRTVQAIKELGMKAGVALNPATPLSQLDYIMADLDLVLLMGVNPGFGGQEFIPQTLDKIRELKKKVKEGGCSLDISVDGGMNTKTAPGAVAAGANIIVAGSAVFGSCDPAAAIGGLRSSSHQ